jgi:predicted dehydrogenase
MEKFAELMAANVIGPVRAVHTTLAKQFLDPKDVRNEPGAGGGALCDLGSYAISGCNMVFRKAPTRAIAAIDVDPVFRIDRLSSGLLDYGDAHATLTVATQAGTAAWGSHQQLTVLRANGWLRFDFPYAHGRPTRSRIELGDTNSVWLPADAIIRIRVHQSVCASVREVLSASARRAGAELAHRGGARKTPNHRSACRFGSRRGLEVRSVTPCFSDCFFFTHLIKTSQNESMDRPMTDAAPASKQ